MVKLWILAVARPAISMVLVPSLEHKDIQLVNLPIKVLYSIFNHKSNSRITNVFLSVCLSVTETTQPLRFAPIVHQAYLPLSLSTIEPINHRTYQPWSLSTFKPIDLWSSFATFKPFGLLTLSGIKNQTFQKPYFCRPADISLSVLKLF